MGRYKTHAKDGTPRCSEPKQDASGNWYCPACGKASGFSSRMAVMGHLRHCRPGKPLLGELLAPLDFAQASPVATPAGAVDPAIAALSSQVAALAQVVRTSTQNHAAHLGMDNAAAHAATKGAPSAGGIPWGKVALWGGGAVAALALVDAVSRPTSRPVRSPARAAACAKQWKEKAEGRRESVETDCIDVDQLSDAEPLERKPFPFTLKGAVSLVRDGAALMKGAKTLFS